MDVLEILGKDLPQRAINAICNAAPRVVNNLAGWFDRWCLLSVTVSGVPGMTQEHYGLLLNK